jgi:SAM-dependent methyltransferase
MNSPSNEAFTPIGFQDVRSDTILYHGHLGRNEVQYLNSSRFIGLCLKPSHDREIAHDITQPLPLPDDFVSAFQSQDVLEHIAFDEAIAALNEVHRCLTPGGFFRLSLPDYNSPLLLKRTVYDHKGNPLADLAMGGRVSVKDLNSPVQVSFVGDPGDAHIWFPTYELVDKLIGATALKNCKTIKFVQGWVDRTRYCLGELDRPEFHVRRRPPLDMRAGGTPISIIVDFEK